MPNNDLQATISTRLGQTLSSMSRVEQRLKKLEEASKQVNRTGSRSVRQQRQLAQANQMSTKAAKDHGRKLKDLAEAASRLGGPIGTLAGQIGGSAGMGGALARVGVAFGVAAAAGVAYGKVVEANIARVRKAIEAEERLTEARKEGRQALRAQAEAGLGQEAEQRLLIARGGEQAVRELEQVQRAGIDRGDAAKGVAAAQLVSPDANIRRAILNAAVRAARTGEISFPEAVERLSDRRSITDVMGRGAGSAAAIARALTDATGRRISTGDFRAIEERVSRSGFLTEADKAQGITSQIDAVQRERVAGGLAEATAREQLAAARNPILDAERRSFLELQRQTLILDRLAEEQGAFIGLLRDLIDTEGGFATQAARARNGAAAAILGRGD